MSRQRLLTIVGAIIVPLVVVLVAKKTVAAGAVGICVLLVLAAAGAGLYAYAARQRLEQQLDDARNRGDADAVAECEAMILLIDRAIWPAVAGVMFALVAILTGPIARGLSEKGFDPVSTCNAIWWIGMPVTVVMWVVARDGENDPRWQRVAAYHRYWAAMAVIGAGIFAAVASVAQDGLNGPHTWAWRISMTMAFAVAALAASGLYDIGKPDLNLTREERYNQIGLGITMVVFAIILAAVTLSLHKPLVKLHIWEQTPAAVTAPATLPAEKAPSPKAPDFTKGGGITADNGYAENN